ncbi:unnamed protein product [Protopolystoma xenopodis]|uniref:Talin central domain-containing protein n=1 Tax=Protopolystoma xenopodis TaxID=117903 RepID=A0A448X6M8_9PLAT|nr:unnamed protein product [Protopolystoma xenopodis]
MRSPGASSSSQLADISSRLAALQAVLQACARGVEACASAAGHLSNVYLIELDQALRTARTGRLRAIASNTATTSMSDEIIGSVGLSPRQREFQGAQEKVMLALKGILEETQVLVSHNTNFATNRPEILTNSTLT